MATERGEKHYSRQQTDLRHAKQLQFHWKSCLALRSVQSFQHLRNTRSDHQRELSFPEKQIENKPINSQHLKSFVHPVFFPGERNRGTCLQIQA
jgi:hypothetical protein